MIQAVSFTRFAHQVYSSKAVTCDLFICALYSTLISCWICFCVPFSVDHIKNSTTIARLRLKLLIWTKWACPSPTLTLKEGYDSYGRSSCMKGYVLGHLLFYFLENINILPATNDKHDTAISSELSIRLRSCWFHISYLLLVFGLLSIPDFYKACDYGLICQLNCL